jgi:hypothetical protein
MNELPSGEYFRVVKMDHMPETSLESFFKDSIQRSVIDIKELLKDENDGYLINRISGNRLILNTLDEVRGAIKNYLALPYDDRINITAKALWFFSIIQYGKCYQSNEGWTVMLQSSATLKNEPDEVKEDHKRFMDQRNTFIAHGGKTTGQLAAVLVCQRKEAPNQIDQVAIDTTTATSPYTEDMARLDHLADVTQKYVIDSSYKIERKIFIRLLENNQIINPDLLKYYGLNNSDNTKNKIEF